MPLRRARLCALVLALVVGAACSSGTPTSTGERRGSTDPAATRTTGSPSSTAPSVTSAPLVLVTHPSRPALDLARPVVDDLLAGQVSDWADLGSDAGPLTLLAATDVEAPGADEVSAAEAVTGAVGRRYGTLGVVPASAVGPGVRVVEVAGVHPLREPTAYGLTTPDEPPPAVTTVSVVGDVMLGRRVGSRMAARGDFAAALRPIAPRLAGADLTIGNLESTLARLGAPRQGTDSFGADPRVRRGLRLAGFDVLSLANNHVGDYGLPSLVETVRLLREGGFTTVGAGADLAQASEPAVVERNDVTFGVLAFDAIGETPAAGRDRPGAFRLRMQPRTGPLDRGDLDRVLDSVRALRARVDVVIVVPHWGTQYTTRTVRDQRRVAGALAAAGADLVLGGHPHWVQGMETRDGALVAYSLGNFVFDMDFSRETQEGVILELVFWGARLKAAEPVPVRIGPDFAPRLARGAAGQAILDRMWSAGGPPLTGTHRNRS